MDFQVMIEQALAVRARYAARETTQYGRPWTREEIALGLLGDVGDLVKLIQAVEGVRAIPDWEAKLAHELADCLWAVIVLADQSGVDLEQAFTATMADLTAHLAAPGADAPDADVNSGPV